MPAAHLSASSQCGNSMELIIENIEKVILGKRQVIEHILISLLCGGHVLLEDVPGVGKTMLVKSFAHTLGCTYKRIQCTPDLLPSDVIGMSIFQSETGRFTFHPGPLFHSMIHVDELNRTSAKTQAAFLEAMEEGQVTVDGHVHPLPRPFLVLATQNPQEHIGTFPLPEAQLDRFFMRIQLGYPNRESELAILDQSQEEHPLTHIQDVITHSQLYALQQQVKAIHVEHFLKLMIIQIMERTRQDSSLRLGASPRASIALLKASQARAMLEGRSYVIPDDIKLMACEVLAHRLVLTPEAQWEGITSNHVIEQILSAIPIPIDRVSGEVSTV